MKNEDIVKCKDCAWYIKGQNFCRCHEIDLDNFIGNCKFYKKRLNPKRDCSKCRHYNKRKNAKSWCRLGIINCKGVEQ